MFCYVEDGKDIEKNARETVDLSSAHERAHQYLMPKQMALESAFIPFKVLSHPVRTSKAIKAVPIDLDDPLLDLARIARKRNKALEPNGRDIDYDSDLVRRLVSVLFEIWSKSSIQSPLNLASLDLPPSDLPHF